MPKTMKCGLDAYGQACILSMLTSGVPSTEEEIRQDILNTVKQEKFDQESHLYFVEGLKTRGYHTAAKIIEQIC